MPRVSSPGCVPLRRQEVDDLVHERTVGGVARVHRRNLGGEVIALPCSGPFFRDNTLIRIRVTSRARYASRIPSSRAGAVDDTDARMPIIGPVAPPRVASVVSCPVATVVSPPS